MPIFPLHTGPAQSDRGHIAAQLGGTAAVREAGRFAVKCDVLGVIISRKRRRGEVWWACAEGTLVPQISSMSCD